MKVLITAGLLTAAALAPAWAEDGPQAVISIGGPITETVYQLGEEDRLIARDTTSVWPEAVMELPDVGYMRALSAEGVLSVDPDLILLRDTSGPPEALEQLRAASVPLVEIHDAFTPEAILNMVDKIGAALNAQPAAEALNAKLRADLKALAAETASLEHPRRVLFLLSAEDGRLVAAGSGNGADGLLKLAGAINILGDEFQGYKPISTEAIITADPEVIVMMSGRVSHEGLPDEILALPAIALTTAGRNKAFMTVEGAALGFGPRTVEFARDLSRRLHAATGD
ncbi:ABC transporter substrate-binding protein [Roseovarius aestuarii]|nr:ABC transporter substrate-binding protein [Roseovarius aestuarii]